MQNALGGYLVVGTVTSVDGNISAPYSPADKWLVALDASGATIWERCVGGSGMDQSHSMRVAPANAAAVSSWPAGAVLRMGTPPRITGMPISGS